VATPAPLRVTERWIWLSRARRAEEQSTEEEERVDQTGERGGVVRRCDERLDGVPSPRRPSSRQAAHAIVYTRRGAVARRRSSRSRQATQAASRHSGIATMSIASSTPVTRRPASPKVEPSAQAR